jgi:hypothetical protein
LPWCIDRILVPQLSGGAYKAEITDHHDNKYVTDLVMGAIETDRLPMGLLSPFAGSYKLRIFSVEDLMEPVHFVFGSDTYNCIYLRFQDTTPAEDEAEIR